MNDYPLWLRAAAQMLRENDPTLRGVANTCEGAADVIATLQRELAEKTTEAAEWKAASESDLAKSIELGEQLDAVTAENAKLRHNKAMDDVSFSVVERERDYYKSCQQYTCEAHRDEVKKGGSCVWCRLANAQSWQESVLAEAGAAPLEAVEYTADQLGSDCVVHYDDYSKLTAHCQHLAAKLVQIDAYVDRLAGDRAFKPLSIVEDLREIMGKLPHQGQPEPEPYVMKPSEEESFFKVLRQRQPKPPDEREPPHCPTCECGQPRCLQAGCTKFAMAGSVLCQEHYDKLPASMREEGPAPKSGEQCQHDLCEPDPTLKLIEGQCDYTVIECTVCQQRWTNPVKVVDESAQKLSDAPKGGEST